MKRILALLLIVIFTGCTSAQKNTEISQVSVYEVTGEELFSKLVLEGSSQGELLSFDLNGKIKSENLVALTGQLNYKDRKYLINGNYDLEKEILKLSSNDERMDWNLIKIDFDKFQGIFYDLDGEENPIELVIK